MGRPVLIFSMSLIASLVLGLSAAEASRDSRGSTDSFWATCEYVKAAPAGPAGNFVLVRAGGESIILARSGRDLKVRAYDSYIGDDDLWMTDAGNLDCGIQPTVFNIDRIEIRTPRDWNMGLVLDQRRGAFEPGATGEGKRSAIEIRMTGNPGGRKNASNLYYLGSPGPDVVRAVGDDGRLGLDMNGNGNGGPRDLEFAPTMRVRSLLVKMGRGDDYFSAAGIGIPRNRRPVKAIIYGNAGNDTLVGGPGQDHFDGGYGRDRIRGMGGGDGGGGLDMNVSGGPGHDLIYGGPGNDVIGNSSGDPEPRGGDVIFGGPGRDSILKRNGIRDRINCGPDFELGVQYDAGLDFVKSCAGRY